MYDVTDEVIQLENGNWGMMARPVQTAYEHHLRVVNRRGSFYGRREYPADFEVVRARVARSLGVAVEEIALTRGATEALQCLIGGYNRLRPGDAVLHADLDYDSMQTAMAWLKARRGADLVTIALPEPATHQSLIDAYAAALAANPRVRLLLLTHVSHRTGLVLPVAEIVEMARARGVDCIVDSAHAWGQIDFTLPDLKADFVGLNAHKWIGAPVGVGVLYCRRERIADIDPFMGEPQTDDEDVRARVHTGTANFAAFLSVPDALDMHDAIGPAYKAARLRSLRDRWAEQVRGYGAIEVLTPRDPRLTCAITSFRLRGRTTPRENAALARELLEKHRIFTVHRTGVARGACVRVTPACFTSEDDIDRLVSALRLLGRA
ncbi:MAG: aminotransferase class V-fold PLP-dependent enzyme [Hyphomonadaceae bacterium]|nr:aminotransferase class V-fold PLP-dependent enzyme [Hyphomonadaceae bacterium]